MKKALKLFFIGIPNIPLIIFITIYVLYNILKHTSFIELNMYDGGNIVTKEIKEHLNKMFPKVLFRSIALCFWLHVISKLIT